MSLDEIQAARVSRDRTKSFQVNGWWAGKGCTARRDSDAFPIRPGDLHDLKDVVALLDSCGLPTSDIFVRPIEFTVACDGDTLIGVVGVEALGEAGLLHSLAVAAAHRHTGLGARLVDHACANAIQAGARELFLLTTSAAGFFEQLGFKRIDRTRVPEAVKQTTEYANLCPASAVCMNRHIASEAQFFPTAALSMRADNSGVAFWSVRLEQTMLTYFEVPPDAKFERHVHEAEQITMVLEGELIFECDDRSPIRVRTHEVIAVPSGVPHAVRAGSEGAKAIDAWSPAHDRYSGRRGHT